MPRSTCHTESLCDRMGLCQDYAKQQLAPCRECDGDGFVDTSGFCDLGTCAACNGSGRVKRMEDDHG
jgi:DnaJ-class molecular chaperone